jgi:flagellar biosynthetic protein FliR
MPLELLAYYLKLPVFMMVLARLAGMLAIQPILSAVSIPVRVRVLLLLALAALMTPFVEFPAAAPDTVGGLALALGGELLVGSLMGLVIATCFVGLQMGGTLVAQNSGLAMGRVADPDSGEDMAILGSLYVQVASVVYLVIGGHRALLAACLDTFEAVPLLGAGGLAKFGADLLLAALAAGRVLAIHVAAPAVLTLVHGEPGHGLYCPHRAAVEHRDDRLLAESPGRVPDHGSCAAFRHEHVRGCAGDELRVAARLHGSLTSPEERRDGGRRYRRTH